MADFKDLSQFSLNTDFFKNMQFENPMQAHMDKMQREQEQMLRSVQRARDEKEAEELRRHNELVQAIKEAAENGATIMIGDNANGIQIQQNSASSTQTMTNTQTLDYEKTLDVLKEIKSYIDFPQFSNTFQENAENVKNVIDSTIVAVEKKEDEKLIKKSLHLLKDLAIGAGGSLIASGILALLGTLPI